MKRKIGLLFLAAFLVFAIQLVFTAGSAQAVYLTDGASKTDANGQWVVDDPGYCTNGTSVLKADANTSLTSAECPQYADDQTTCAASVKACTDGASATQLACETAGYKWVAPRSWTTQNGGLSTACFATFTNERTYAKGVWGTEDTKSYEGCLHCHNQNYMEKRQFLSDGTINPAKVRHDGSYFRAMEPYLTSGHKNVLRKVSAGSPMGGPLFTSGEAGTAAYTNVDWATGFQSGTTTPINYIYNSFFEAVKIAQVTRTTMSDPTTVSLISNSASVRTCLYCHTGGFGFAGANNGTEYAPQTAWAYNGVQCTTCHGLINSPTTGTGFEDHHTGWSEAGPAGGGPRVTQMCMNCHRYEATSAPITDPTIQAGALVIEEIGSHHANYGGQFLNSPHAKFTGTWGDITNDASYTSHFKSGTGAYVCSDPAYTTITTCTTALETWDEVEANAGCTGCHEVHESSVDADVLDPTTLYSNMKNSCGVSCHPYKVAAGAPSYGIPQINHPSGANTPLDGDVATDKGVTMACVTCHMGKTISHVWRVNVDPTYETMNHTLGEPNTYNGGEIGLDLGYACGQCHGGDYQGTCKTSAGATVMTCGRGNNEACTEKSLCLAEDATHVWTPDGKGNIATISKGLQSVYAVNMHNTLPKTANFTATTSLTVPKQVDFVATPGTGTSFTWNFGDGTVATVATAATSHTYPAGGTYSAVVTVDGTAISPVKAVTASSAANTNPTASRTVSVAGWVVTIADSSTDLESAQSALKVTVGCGSGGVKNPSTATVAANTVVTCTYTTAGNRVITHKVADPDGGTTTSSNQTVYVPTKYTVSGKVTKSDGTTGVYGVILYLNNGTKNTNSTSTKSDGTFTFTNVVPGTYNVVALKSGYTFASPAVSGLAVTGVTTGVNFSSVTP